MSITAYPPWEFSGTLCSIPQRTMCLLAEYHLFSRWNDGEALIHAGAQLFLGADTESDLSVQVRRFANSAGRDYPNN
jgi:hypothetical protein